MSFRILATSGSLVLVVGVCYSPAQQKTQITRLAFISNSQISGWKNRFCFCFCFLIFHIGKMICMIYVPGFYRELGVHSQNIFIDRKQMLSLCLTEETEYYERIQVIHGKRYFKICYFAG